MGKGHSALVLRKQYSGVEDYGKPDSMPLEGGSSAAAAAAAAKSLQSCPTLCDPIDGSLPGFAVPGILQARTLEWVAIYFSIVWKWKVKVKSLSHVRLVATPWTAAYQAPPSMGFSRQEYWSGVPLPSPGGSSTPEQFITATETPGFSIVEFSDSSTKARSQESCNVLLYLEMWHF